MNWENQRLSMVNHQLRARGIRDNDVLRVMENLPRHRFVPPDEADHAYDDSPLSIGTGQTISQPYIVAYMTELLQPDRSHKVLEIGTGSGYQTAILAALAGRVFTIEVHPALQQQARATLDELGFDNIEYDIRNGRHGWPEAAPFDRIMVTAGAEAIPDALIEQLAPGGRMVIPVGRQLEDQMLKVVSRRGPFDVDIRDTVPVRFVPLV